MAASCTPRHRDAQRALATLSDHESPPSSSSSSSSGRCLLVHAAEPRRRRTKIIHSGRLEVTRAPSIACPESCARRSERDGERRGCDGVEWRARRRWKLYYMARGGANVELGVDCWFGGEGSREGDSQLCAMRAKTCQHARGEERGRKERWKKRSWFHPLYCDQLAKVSFSKCLQEIQTSN